MGGDIEDRIKDLIQYALTIDENFTVFDAESTCMKLIMDRNNRKFDMQLN